MQQDRAPPDHDTRLALAARCHRSEPLERADARFQYQGMASDTPSSIFLALLPLINRAFFAFSRQQPSELLMEVGTHAGTERFAWP